MNDDILKILISTHNSKGDYILTYQLIDILDENFDNALDIINLLINENIIDRLIDEHYDVCSLDTIRFKRILKLDILNKN